MYIYNVNLDVRILSTLGCWASGHHCIIVIPIHKGKQKRCWYSIHDWVPIIIQNNWFSLFNYVFLLKSHLKTIICCDTNAAWISSRRLSTKPPGVTLLISSVPTSRVTDCRCSLWQSHMFKHKLPQSLQGVYGKTSGKKTKTFGTPPLSMDNPHLSHDFPIIFPWLSHHFPIIFPWMSHHFPMTVLFNLAIFGATPPSLGHTAAARHTRSPSAFSGAASTPRPSLFLSWTCADRDTTMLQEERHHLL